MPVLDLTQSKGGCDVSLQKVDHRPDPSSDALVIRVDLLMILASRAEAEVVEAMLPGLGEVFDRAGENDNWKGANAVKPSESLTVVLTAKEAGEGRRQGPVAPGGVIVQGQADLIELKASMSKRQRAVLVRLVFRGHGEEALARLAGVQRLGGSVGMAFEKRQAVLPFATSKQAPALKVGMVLAFSHGETQLIGRLTEVDQEILSLQEAGTELSVHLNDVISAFSFAQDSETSAALSDYAERCERRKVPLSWRALVQVLVARTGITEGVPMGAQTVTADDVEAAMAKLDAQAGQPSTEETTPDQPMGEVLTIPDQSKRKPRARAQA